MRKYMPFVNSASFSSPLNASFTLGALKNSRDSVRSCRVFLFAWASHLQKQNIFRGICGLCPKVFDLLFVPVSQVVKSQAVLFRVHKPA